MHDILSPDDELPRMIVAYLGCRVNQDEAIGKKEMIDSRFSVIQPERYSLWLYENGVKWGDSLIPEDYVNEVLYVR